MADQFMAKRQDHKWMGMAMRLAAEGLGRTGSNPSVGCVIVRGTARGVELLGCGRTGDGGIPHGEFHALTMAGAAARGANLYVTLEPCSHFGKSPPCADAIIKAGISRVVLAVKDPNPDVGGAGIKRLRNAGVEVVVGVLEDEAAWLTAGHILRMGARRPFVQLKLGVSRDGLIAPGGGAPIWVTGDLARRRGHLLRAHADAILIGLGTVKADNPSLDCRLPGLEQFSPIPVVLDSQLRIDPNARLVANSADRPLHIIHGPLTDDGDMSDRRHTLAAKGVELHLVENDEDGGLDITEILARLSELGVTRLMVEGGPSVARSFEASGLIDEVVIFRGAKPVKGQGLLPLVSKGLEVFNDPAAWENGQEFSCGADIMMVKRNRKTLELLRAATGEASSFTCGKASD